MKLHKSLLMFGLPLLLLLNACNYGSTTTITNNSKSMSAYQNWISSLTAESYTVAQGSAYLLTESACSELLNIFNSCFANNPSSPYVFPAPPIGHSYVDPFYATPFTITSPTGESSNMFYRLTNNEAMITLVAYPDKAAYFGFTSYMFSRESDWYSPQPVAAVLTPDPSRYQVFGSSGDTVNDVIVQNKFGSPWGGNIIMYVTTANISIANSLITNATANGINPNSIFINPIGSNIHLGANESADDMATLIRYAVPQESTAAATWIANVNNNVIVYKVSNTSLPAYTYGDTPYTKRGVSNSEQQLQNSLNELSGLLQAWLQSNQAGTIKIQSFAEVQTDSPDGTPEGGLVGSNCIATGIPCAGDNTNAIYSFQFTKALPESNTMFIAGINHNQLSNTSYFNISLYNPVTSMGLISLSQTNPLAVGFDSGILAGSAAAVLQGLGIYNQASAQLIANLPALYVTQISWICSNPATALYCINLSQTSLLTTESMSFAERAYILPGTTTAPNPNILLYPRIIAGAASLY